MKKVNILRFHITLVACCSFRCTLSLYCQLTPILAKVFESTVLKWVDNIIIPQIDDKQFGGMAGTGTADALVEMLHKWYKATDEPGTTVRVLFLDHSKAFGLINNEILINKLVAMNLPAHIVRWMAAFLLDRQ